LIVYNDSKVDVNTLESFKAKINIAF